MARTANVGRISVSLDANTVRYINNIKKAQVATDKRLDTMSKKFKRFGKNAQTSMDKIRKGALGLVAGLGAVSAISLVWINRQREMMDQLAKTSDALGIQQERLQALQHVGELNGVTTTQLNTSLQRMQKNLGDAAKGSGESALALHQLGINIGEITKLSPDKQIDLLANSLTNVELQTDKARLAQNIFGRNGVRVLKVLEALKKDGLEPTAQALSDMGIALNRVDTAKVESANDAIFKTQQVIEGLVNKLTIALAPVLEELSNDFISMAKDSKGFADDIATGLEVVTRVTNVVIGTIRTLWNTAQLMGNGLETVFNGLRGAGEAWGVDIAHLVSSVSFGFTNMTTVISNMWGSAFGKMKLTVAEWAQSIGEILVNVPGLSDVGIDLMRGSKAAIASANASLAAIGASQKKIDDAKLARDTLYNQAKLQVQTEYEARQAVIQAKFAQNTKDLLGAITQTSTGIFGEDGDTDPAAEETAATDKNAEELAKTKLHYDSLLEAYADYDSRLNAIRDLSQEMQVGRLMGDLDAIGEGLGASLKLQETYAKATAAMNAVLTAVQVWGDPSLTFYEKIPASIAATASVLALAGQFHGGTDSVPDSMNNKSFMLKAGERVVQPEANKKLTKFLDAPESAGATAGNIEISAPVTIQGNVTDQNWFKNELYSHRQLISDATRKAQREKPRR